MNLTDLTEAAQCKHQSHTDPRWLTGVKWAWAPSCPRCVDHPGIDPDIMHTQDDPDCPFVLPESGIETLVVIPVDLT